MARRRKMAAWAMTEPTYGTDGSDNGSGYTFLPATGVSLITDNLALLETNWDLGRNFPTAKLAGRDAWAAELDLPWTGLGTAAGDGASPPAEDYLDLFLKHILATSTTVDGEGVASSGNTDLELATDSLDVQDLAAVYEAGIPSGAVRTQWRRMLTDDSAGNYTTSDAWDSNPTASAVCYGTRTYQPSDAGGSSMSLVVRQDDQDYTLSGGRVVGARITGALDDWSRLKLAIVGDNKTAESKASLPDAVPFARQPCKPLLSPLRFGGTEYETQGFEFDFGISAAERGSTAAAQGRAEWESIAVKPMLTFSPLYTDALNALRRSATEGRMLLQIGAGVLSGGELNTTAIYAENAQLTEVGSTDENGRIRAAAKLEVVDPGYWSAGVLSRFLQIVRA